MVFQVRRILLILLVIFLCLSIRCEAQSCNSYFAPGATSIFVPTHVSNVSTVSSCTNPAFNGVVTQSFDTGENFFLNQFIPISTLTNCGGTLSPQIPSTTTTNSGNPSTITTIAVQGTVASYQSSNILQVSNIKQYN
jgi:hypothetical protein